MNKHICTALALLGASVAPAMAATLTGLWEFNDGGNLGQATVGNNLTFAGAAPGTWSASLQDDQADSLTGVITTAAAVSGNQIVANHGISPNGGGAYVNQYSILFDVFSPAGSRSSWRTLFQTNTGNANDGEYFIRNNDGKIGVGEIGYSALAPDATSWSRLVLTFSLAGSGASDVRAYLDGSLYHTHTLTGGLDGRFALDPTVLLLSDNDGDNAPLNVGAIAIYDGALSPAEVAALGAAGAAIPVPEPGISLMGLVAVAGMAIRRRRA